MSTDAPTAQDKKLFKKGGKSGPGRPKGSKDKLAAAEKQKIADVFKALIGFDGMSPRGIRVRDRLGEMLEGVRDVDEKYVRLLQFGMSYAYGLPMRMTPDTEGVMRRRMAFITANGLPWDQDPLHERESKLLAIQRHDEELQAGLDAERAMASSRPAAPEGAVVDGETLELVRSRDFDLGDR